MFASLVAGIFLGLPAGFAPGPLLTLVIAQTLKHNIREGVKVALAPLITDLPIILASLYLFSRLTSFDIALGAISLVGGLYILYLAYESVTCGPVETALDESPPRSLWKGVIINALNPHPYLFWMTVGAPLIIKYYDNNPLAPAGFLVCFYSMLILSKILIALIVGRSSGFLTSRGYLRVMRILGLILAFFAFILLKDALVYLKIVEGAS
ncbi:MAG: LysE family translocator [Desulfobacterales bacterium]|nr:LysE family translocator [Desulfobacterales bacterium]